MPDPLMVRRPRERPSRTTRASERPTLMQANASAPSPFETLGLLKKPKLLRMRERGSRSRHVSGGNVAPLVPHSTGSKSFGSNSRFVEQNSQVTPMRPSSPTMSRRSCGVNRRSIASIFS